MLLALNAFERFNMKCLKMDEEAIRWNVPWQACIKQMDSFVTPQWLHISEKQVMGKSNI